MLKNRTHQNALLSLSCRKWMNRRSESLHNILPQTGGWCFPNLLFLSTIQCDSIHPSAPDIHSKWSAEAGWLHSFTTLPSFTFSDWPNNMKFTLCHKLCTWGCLIIDYMAGSECYQTAIIGITLLWKRHVAACSNMDFSMVYTDITAVNTPAQLY